MTSFFDVWLRTALSLTSLFTFCCPSGQADKKVCHFATLGEITWAPSHHGTPQPALPRPQSKPHAHLLALLSPAIFQPDGDSALPKRPHCVKNSPFHTLSVVWRNRSWHPNQMLDGGPFCSSRLTMTREKGQVYPSSYIHFNCVL